MALKYYDPDLQVMYFNGVLIGGLADGEFCTWERAAKGFEYVVGTTGEVARSKQNNPIVIFTFKLLQTSSTNLAFSIIHATDLAAPNGAGVGSFLYQDIGGATIIKGAKAWIEQFPNGNRDRTAKPAEWKIIVVADSHVEGGNQ